MTNTAPMGFWYRSGWTFFRILFATYFRWRVFHPERVPREGAAILAANHTSFLDPPLVGSGLPRRVTMLARQSLFRFPVFGSLLRAWHAVPVDPRGGSPAGLKAIADSLQTGQAVLIFPEGTRSADGQIKPARSGLGLVVIRSQAPVIPIRIWGTYEAYGRGLHCPRPKPVAVKYGHPLPFLELRQEAQRCSKQRLKAIYQEVTDQTMAAIAGLKPERDQD